MLVADAHVDLLLELHHRRHRLGQSGAFAHGWLPLLERGGVGLQVCPVFVDVALQPEGALREALGQVAALHAAVGEAPGRVTLVRTPADLDAVEAGTRIGLVLALEGVEPFGVELWPLDVFVALGLRMASCSSSPATRPCSSRTRPAAPCTTTRATSPTRSFARSPRAAECSA